MKARATAVSAAISLALGFSLPNIGAVAETIEAEVNGREIAKVDVVKTGKDAAGNWRIDLKDVPLDPGKNEVRLWVSNKDGRCRQPGSLEVVYAPPAKPDAPPEVEILDPAKDANVTEPGQKIKFRVRSATPLRSTTRSMPCPL